MTDGSFVDTQEVRDISEGFWVVCEHRATFLCVSLCLLENIHVCVSVCELSCDGLTSPCVPDETFVHILFALFLSFCPFSPMSIKK